MKYKKCKVLVVGSAENSKGGISSVIKLLKNSFLWNKYECKWLETQIHSNICVKLCYVLRAYFYALISLHQYSIIHFHTIPGRSIKIQLPIFLLSLLYRKKIILHIHVGNQLERYSKDKFFLFCLKHSDLIIFLSNNIKKKFEKFYPQITTSVTVVYNPCENVTPKIYANRDNIILYAGILNSNKAYDLLLKAYSYVKNELKDWKIVFLGNGEIKKAQKLSSSLGISENVEFHGYLIGNDKKRFFENSSIFCLCSYQEGFPMAVIEAWSYGIPVITTRVGALPEVIIENKNAITFNFGDPLELAEKLKFCVENYALREKMSSFASSFSKDKFSLSTISHQLDKLYSSLIQL